MVRFHYGRLAIPTCPRAQLSKDESARISRLRAREYGWVEGVMIIGSAE